MNIWGYIFVGLIMFVICMVGSAIKFYFNTGHVNLRTLKWLALFYIVLFVFGGISIFVLK